MFQISKVICVLLVIKKSDYVFLKKNFKHLLHILFCWALFLCVAKSAKFQGKLVNTKTVDGRNCIDCMTG